MWFALFGWYCWHCLVCYLYSLFEEQNDMIDKYGSGKRELVKDEMKPVLEDVENNTNLLEEYTMGCYSNS